MAENKKIGGKIDQKDCCSIVAAVFLPPLAVYLEQGCGTPCFINIALCFLFWFPAILHALWIVWKGMEARKKAGEQPVLPVANPVTDPKPMEMAAAPAATEAAPAPVAEPAAAAAATVEVPATAAEVPSEKQV